MIATWMLYCSICALGLYAAAVLAERALLVGAGPVRQVWIGAIVLSLLIPGVAYRFASFPTTIVPIASAAGAVPIVPAFDSLSYVSQLVATAGRPQSPQWSWRGLMTTLSRANQPLAIAWVALSSALGLYFLVGLIALARLRRRWERREVLGVPVLISDRAGPAVVGAVTPAIVMPEWALAMAPQQLGLMLRHEEEHRRAGDALLMMAAHLALIAMPWNAALWRLIVRLGMAVELDCDARVLRDADARSYGDLLLEVARPRRGPPLIGAMAFAERAGQLERRIRAIAQRRSPASRAARAAAALIGIAALSAAWAAPRPSAPPRSSSQNAQAALPIIGPIVDSAPSAQSSAIEHSKSTSAKPGTLPSGDRPVPINDNTLKTLDALPPVQLTATGGSSPMVDSVFNRLFTGITLSADQEAAVRELIATLERRQLAVVLSATQDILRAMPAVFALGARRDSALRALLLTDADRAVFDARVAQNGAGTSSGGRARGRSGSGSVPLDSIGGGRVGRSGGGDPNIFGRGRGGRGASMAVGGLAPAIGVGGPDQTFDLLFGGFVLTPDQEATARTIIGIARSELISLLPERPLEELALHPNPNGGVLMRPEGRAILLSLLTNDADRSVVNSRIAVETRIVVRDRAAPPRP